MDLRKVFDRVEHTALFKALENQGIRSCYIKLLQKIYEHQSGVIDGKVDFPITRGVRQGDVLSPLLFNCVLDDAIRTWKKKLRNHGIVVKRRARRRTTDKYTFRGRSSTFCQDYGRGAKYARFIDRDTSNIWSRTKCKEDEITFNNYYK